MRYSWLIGVLLLSFSALTHAQGICARITGSWYGSFTLKDPHDCHIYRGCTHSINIHVNRFDGPTYIAEVKPSMGRGGTFKFNCDDGKIASSSHPDSKIELNCPDTKVCIVKYDDPKQYATVIGAGVD